MKSQTAAVGRNSLAASFFRSAPAFFMACLLAACGTWVGNPKSQTSGTPDAGGSTKVSLEPGASAWQLVKLDANGELGAEYDIAGAPNLAVLDPILALVGIARQTFELSLSRADGLERLFQRTAELKASVRKRLDANAWARVQIRNSGTSAISLSAGSVSGVLEDKGFTTTSSALHKDIALKAVMVFARECHQMGSDGNTKAVYPPAGEAFIQPLVFFGKVVGGKPELLSKAQISIEADGKSYPLKALPDLNYDVYREMGGLSQAQHVAYTRNFYQAYMGAVGEFYTTDTVRFAGDCSQAPHVKLQGDTGKTEVRLVVKDASVSPVVDESIIVRTAVNPPFSFYEAAGKKLQDYTQCTWNRGTGEPTTYNGDATACKEFSLGELPYLSLDYKLPSEEHPSLYSVESDPTRIMLYGYSMSKSFYKELMANADALISGASTSVILPACMTSGGSTNVPLSTEKTALPLYELNTRKGDVLNIASMAGRYNGLPEFFQGNADGAVELDFPTCIPKNGDCQDWKVVRVKMGACTRKADSGVFATGLVNRFIYPGDFTTSGVIVD